MRKPFVIRMTKDPEWLFKIIYLDFGEPGQTCRIDHLFRLFFGWKHLTQKRVDLICRTAPAGGEMDVYVNDGKLVPTFGEIIDWERRIHALL